MTFQALSSIAQECGFTNWAQLNLSTIELKPEVRDMCVANTCGMYDKCWSCPPGCGSLDECREQLKGFSQGILVQTVGEVEDAFDIETMMELNDQHKACFARMYARLRQSGQPVLPLGAGCCTYCKTCSYPNTPCRFPDKKISSMEAYGMLVLDVCKANNLQYYYGTGKIAYTGCFLIP